MANSPAARQLSARMDSEAFRLIEDRMSLRAAPVRLHYAWLVAGVTLLVLLIAAGTRSIPGILIVPLEHEFGWTRATLSLAVSINLLLYGLGGPFAAAIM